MAAASAVIDRLLCRLAAIGPDELPSVVKEDMIHVKKALSRWHVVVESTEKQLFEGVTGEHLEMSKALMSKENKMRKIKQIAYCIEDILDEFEGCGRSGSGGSSGRSEEVFCCSSGPSFLPSTMASRMKMVRKKLERESEKSIIFQLLHDSKPDLVTSDGHGSSDLNSIIGRENDKANIKIIINDAGPFSIIPIVGLSGIGKTALARLIFNDRGEDSKFDHHIWISLHMNFDLCYIVSGIISQAGNKEEGPSQKNKWTLRNLLREVLTDKRSLVVLDDLWSMDRNQLDELKEMMSTVICSVIVTTSSEEVAKLFNTVSPYKLGQLSDSDCWTIFSGVASEDQETRDHVVRLCQGMPIVAHSLSSVVHAKGKNVLKDANNKELWHLEKRLVPKVKMFQPLKNIYYRMPSGLKSCLGYLSIFPKGIQIDTEKLIWQWSALDMLGSSHGILSPYVQGKNYIQSLLSIFFLQTPDPCSANGMVLTNGKNVLEMHSLVHSFARYLSCDELIILEDEIAPVRSKNKVTFRYALLLECNEASTISKGFLTRARAVSFKGCKERKLPGEALSALRHLNVLDLSGCSFLELPSSVGQLKNLRYLDVSHSAIQSLPSDLRCLQNLEALDLSKTSVSVPLDPIGPFKKLKYLNLQECPNLRDLLQSFGDLKGLEHLNLSHCSGVSELPETLCGFSALQLLDLSSCSGLEKLPQSFGSLKNLGDLNLSGCSRLEQLSESFHELYSLKFLNLESCSMLQQLPALFGNLKALESLNLASCISLQELPKSFGDLYFLRVLNLESCFGLQESPQFLGNLLNLEKLNLSHISLELPEALVNLRRLHTLDLTGCGFKKSFPDIVNKITNLKIVLTNDSRLALSFSRHIFVSTENNKQSCLASRMVQSSDLEGIIGETDAEEILETPETRKGTTDRANPQQETSTPFDMVSHMVQSSDLEGIMGETDAEEILETPETRKGTTDRANPQQETSTPFDMVSHMVQSNDLEGIMGETDAEEILEIPETRKGTTDRANPQQETSTPFDMIAVENKDSSADVFGYSSENVECSAGQLHLSERLRLTTFVGEQAACSHMASTAATPEAGNNHSEDSTAHGGTTGERAMVTDNTRQESIDSSSTRNLVAHSHESRVTVDFEHLWRLRKYLLLIGILAVSATYKAGLTPPGGFWSKNINNGRSGHDAGDPVLRAWFFPRYEVFFYCNATAFAASLVLIILLLSKNVTRQKLWLRSMQLTMILDLFSLMGAYAAGSYREVKSSIYIWILVFSVFIYIMIHILVFVRVVPKFVSEKRFVPKWLKDMAVSVQDWILSRCDVPRSGRNNSHEKDLEEARKFILMLVTFAATVTYQAGLSPPGGFWAEDGDKIPATSMLRSKNLARYNTFVICNSTSFVASLVTIILLLSPELSGHGIRSKAVIVCVVVDIFGLVGAYAAGSCRSVATSVCVILIAVVVWICFAVLAGTFVNRSVAGWFRKIKPDIMWYMDKFGRVVSLNLGSERSRNPEGENSIASNQQIADCIKDAAEPETARIPEYQQVLNVKEGESPGEQQSPGKQQPTNTGVVTDKLAENSSNVTCNLEGQCTDPNSVANEAMSETETENMQDANMEEQSSLAPITVAGFSNREHQLVDNHRIQSMIVQSFSTDDQESTTVECLSDIASNNHNRATNSFKKEEKTSEETSEATEIESSETSKVSRPIDNGNIGMHEVAPTQNARNVNAGANPTDERLKKSQSYLLLLAILAVSLTYQSGLNPPGGFWSQRENNHLPGDPILEDTHHRRYIAFFYLNATAFVVSIVMIIMLLNKRMSNKVIKRYALQITMVVDLLALTGSYAMGSSRDRKSSIYIWLLVFLVLAYVVVHVLIAIHVIPEGCKQFVAHKIENLSYRYIWTKPSYGINRSDANDNDCELGLSQRGNADDKNWEQRRNLLLILAILAATVTYQAGMNPPGGVWSDDEAVSGKPGDPILQHNNFKRYDVFYYSNSVSFVASVVITILLVNKESCEHGIKSYALRVCLVMGLVSLLIAYSAGSCRKARESIYLIIIAVAVLIALVIQVLLSSTQDSLRGPTGQFIERLLQLLFVKDEAWHGENSDSSEKKVRKRHKYLMLLAVLAASITYQAGLNPPGGFWSDDEGHVKGNPGLKPPGKLWSDNKGHLAGNPVLLDINPLRYKIFFCSNSISFMASIVVVMYLLNKSARKKDVPLEVLHLIMILDLLALMTAFAAGSCRKFSTSVYVYALVLGVVVYLVIVVLLSSGIAKCLKPTERNKVSSQRCPTHASTTSSLILEDQV